MYCNIIPQRYDYHPLKNIDDLAVENALILNTFCLPLSFYPLTFLIYENEETLRPYQEGRKIQKVGSSVSLVMSSSVLKS